MTIRRLELAVALTCMMACAFYPLEAAEGEMPPVIEAGLKAWKTGGEQAVVTEWAKGGPLEGNTQNLSNANVLKQMGDLFGPYQGADLAQLHDVSSATRVAYVVLNYAKGPLFVKFLLSRSGSQYVVVSYKLNTDPEQVFPGGLLYH